MNTSMTLKEVLLEEARTTYDITEKLFRRVADNELSWKPPTGSNWMTVGQLLRHCAEFGCGKAIQGFVSGEWDLSESPGIPDAGMHVPSASALPFVESVGQALALLADDRSLSLRCLAGVEERDLLSRRLTAPWGGSELSLFQHLLMVIEHLAQHKGQLFYYLKLMGRKLETADLWGS
jgi:uncharacterized damage-inducible protein DinB